MPKINQKEYKILKTLDDKWQWIAININDTLRVFQNKPRKIALEWIDDDWMSFPEVTVFRFIKWSDKKPYNIAELIEEYEYSTEHVSHVVNERVRALGKAWSESEETEVKDKEHTDLMEDFRYGRITPNKFRETIGLVDAESEEAEVKKQELIKNIKYLARETSQQWPHEEMVELPDVLELINQLDEPEVLSQEWIGENVEYAYYEKPDGGYSSATAVINPKDLENLLVPKHEKVKIPQYVAQWLKKHEQHTAPIILKLLGLLTQTKLKPLLI